MVEVRIAEETLALRPEGTAFWSRRRTLLAADVHLGKAASFRAAALPLPGGTTQGGLQRLSREIEETGAERLVFLGDLWHAKAGRTERNLEELGRWRRRHQGVEMVLVEGNHDQRAGALPSELGIAEVPEGEIDGPFVLCHHPGEHSEGYVLCGHIHPGATLTGAGRQAITLPCFWFRPGYAVLPAFGEFTGMGRVLPTREDEVFVIADGQVIKVS